MQTPDARKCFRAGRIAALALGATLILFLHIHGHALFQAKWMVCWLWVLPAFLLAEVWRRKYARTPSADETGRDVEPGLVLLLLMGLYLFSSAAWDRNFYFQGWPPVNSWRARWLDSWPALLLLFSAWLTPLGLVRWKKSWLPLLLALLGAQALCIIRFWTATHALPLYSDDHPSFMFRLWILGHNLPRLTAYLPFWNGGVVEARVVSSGAFSIGALLWPLWRFGNMAGVYTPGLALLFLLLVPAMAAASVRLVGGSWSAALAAAILSLGINRMFFVWYLHFGTVASVVCAPFLMPMCAGLYRIWWRDRREWWVGLVLVICTLLFVAWPADAIMSTALAVGLLFSLRVWSGRKLAFLVACGIGLGLLALPQLLTILRHTDVGGFSRMNSWQTWSLKDALFDGVGELKDHLRQAHPALVFLGLAGVWLLPQRGVPLFYGSILVVLALITGWGEEWKPQYSLARTGIPLFFVATLPAGLWLGRIMEHSSVRWAPARAAVLALLVLGGWNAARFYQNDSIPRYRVMGGEINGLVDWVKQNVPADGRVLFAGYTIHGVGGGHVAFLPILTGREMMACDYYHFSPSKVEYEYPPRPFRDTPEGMMRFCDLYNVTHVITFHEDWLKFFRAHPEQYQEQYTFGQKTKKVVFKVNRPSDLLAQGRGAVRAGLDRISVRVEDPHEEIILKYNWNDGLVVDAPAQIRPYDMGQNIRLIAARPNGRTNFTIRYPVWF